MLKAISRVTASLKESVLRTQLKIDLADLQDENNQLHKGVRAKGRAINNLRDVNSDLKDEVSALRRKVSEFRSNYANHAGLAISVLTTPVKMLKVNEVFKVHSGTALTADSFEKIHPADAPGNCIGMFCAKDKKGNFVLLVEADPQSDQFSNWNTGKYSHLRVSGKAITRENNPALFDSFLAVSGYSFVPERIVQIGSARPKSESAYNSLWANIQNMGSRLVHAYG